MPERADKLYAEIEKENNCNSIKSRLKLYIKPQTLKQMKKGMIKVSALYPNGEGSTFDLDYYCNKHVPMVKNLLGDALKELTVGKGIAGGDPNSPAPYLAIGYLYFESVEDFQNSFGPHAGKIMADTPNYTNTQPVIQVSEVQL